MSPEICWNNLEDLFGSHCFQDSHFGFAIEPITALCLNRRRTIFEKPLRKWDAQRMHHACGLDAGQDATATREDLHVRRALNAPFEFIHAGAGEDGVSVGIDESWKDHFA